MRFRSEKRRFEVVFSPDKKWIKSEISRVFDFAARNLLRVFDFAAGICYNYTNSKTKDLRARVEGAPPHRAPGVAAPCRRISRGAPVPQLA